MAVEPGGLGGVLSKAGRAALRAVVPLLFILGYGLLDAKDLNGLKLQATTFAVGVAIVVFTTLSAIVPQLSWRNYVSEAYAKYLDAATQAFVGTFAMLATGWLGAPDWSNWRSFIVGAVIAALNAVVRAVQAVFSPEPVLDPNVEPKVKPRSVLARA